MNIMDSKSLLHTAFKYWMPLKWETCALEIISLDYIQWHCGRHFRLCVCLCRMCKTTFHTRFYKLCTSVLARLKYIRWKTKKKTPTNEYTQQTFNNTREPIYWRVVNMSSSVLKWTTSKLHMDTRKHHLMPYALCIM